MQIAHLHIKVARALAAVLISKIRHVRHLRRIEQVFEVVRLVYEQAVHAETFEINVVIVPCHITETFDLRFQLCTLFRQLLHREVFSGLLFLGLLLCCDDLVDLFLIVPCLRFL